MALYRCRPGWLALAALLQAATGDLGVATSTSTSDNDAAFIGRVGADLVLTTSRRASGGDPVRFNGVDVIALYQSVDMEVGQLTAHFNTTTRATLANADCTTVWPDMAGSHPYFIGRIGSDIILNAAADGRVLVDGIPVVEAVRELRCVVDAIKVRELGSSASLPGSSGEPPPPSPFSRPLSPILASSSPILSASRLSLAFLLLARRRTSLPPCCHLNLPFWSLHWHRLHTHLRSQLRPARTVQPRNLGVQTSAKVRAAGVAST